MSYYKVEWSSENLVFFSNWIELILYLNCVERLGWLGGGLYNEEGSIDK